MDEFVRNSSLFNVSEDEIRHTDDSNMSDEDSNDCLSSEEEEATQHDSVFLAHTRLRREKLVGHGLASKVREILDCITDCGLDLPLFLDALSWGSPDCHSDRKIQYARTSLLASKELPAILRRWYKPPKRALDSQWGGKRPEGARRIMYQFALECVADRIDREMKASAFLFKSPHELSEDNLLNTNFSMWAKSVQNSAPVLWKIVESASRRHIRGSQQISESDKTLSDLRNLSVVAQLQYRRSRHYNHFQKIWAIYLKACGLAARAFDAIHAIGFVMSHKWTSNAYGFLSRNAMNEVRTAVLNSPFNLTHDNVNIPLRVFSQRMHNQNHFVNATAATVWILPQEAALPADANRNFNDFRAVHSKTVFNFEEVLYGSDLVDNRIDAQHKYRILRVLLECADFSEYKHRDSPLFFPPPPVDKLPHGSKYCTKQFMLGTCDIEEASYEGTLKVMDEIFRQLQLDTKDAQKTTSISTFIPWIGDQLTVERLRGLWKNRHEDHNSHDRMDYMVPIFGWFHLVMAFANSLHKQYLGTSAGIGGMRHAFDLLKRKGLITQATKGPFWHHLDEAIQHISEAHIRAAWLEAANVENISLLLSKSPVELVAIAENIFTEYCTRQSITKIDHKPVEEQDHVKRQCILWNSDVLPYLELREAIKVGDVGRIEDLLPILLFRFAGGGNSKYTIEILELLQGLKQEWPSDIKNHIKKWCWLMNRTGKPDNYLPFDLGQEENIADIKVNYRSMGPGATIEYMKTVSPAIPTLRKLQRHMEEELKTNIRGAHHSSPDKETDVLHLATHYTKSRIYKNIPGRRIKSSSDQADDFVSNGANNLERQHTIEEWFNRRSLSRSSEEDWDSDIAM